VDFTKSGISDNSMHPIARFVLLVTLLIGASVHFSSDAEAALQLIKCEGTGVNADMQLLPNKSFFFKFDSLTESIPWAVGDGLTKIVIMQIDPDHLNLSAETQYDPRVVHNSKYVFVINRNTGDVTVAYDGPLPQANASYDVTCRPTSKAL
jgi:hypothetical protein